MTDDRRPNMTEMDLSKATSASAVDPVCGMRVDPETAKFSYQHDGRAYFFCCSGCLSKFQVDPERVLSVPPRPMGSGLISLGAPAAAPAMAKAAAEAGKADQRTYVCPMCPEV